MDYLNTKWYVVVDDLVGGWAITNVDRPMSDRSYCRPYTGRAIADGFWDRDHAQHVVDLHNTWLANKEEDENE